jgi:hypothetical protein
MHSVIRMVAVLAVVLAACGGSDDDQAAQPPEDGSGETERPSALMITPIHEAQVVRGDDGMDHVEYDLLVVSVFSEPVTLTSVVVLGPDGDELLNLEGDPLAATTQTLFDKKPSAVVPASGAVAIDVDVIVPPDTAPEMVTHRITYTLEEDSTLKAIIAVPEIDGPEVAVDDAPAIEIKPPVKGDGWVAVAACCGSNVHRDLRVAVDGRRIETPETFAVDWAMVKNDRVFDGDGSTNEQFYAYGAEVLAVADGTVVFAQDGKEDQVPGQAMVPKDFSDFGGNQVILQIADDVYVWYAHLQMGSVAVEVGDEVEVGTPLAKLGNTGPSLGPHLHIGLIDKPSPTTARGLPFVIDDYTLVGRADVAASTGDTLVITPESQEISAAYPLYGSIVNFP